jgi:hypothetical protein
MRPRGWFCQDQSGLGGIQERPNVAPEPTFPTDIRARTRSDIGRSASGKAETTSVTADSRKLDEGETLVLAIRPLEICSSELGKRIDRPFEREVPRERF